MKRTCGHCGARYDSVSQLRSMKRISEAEVAPHVTQWPKNVIVEVRQCASCDHPIACLAPAISR